MPNSAGPRFARVRIAGVISATVLALLLIAPGRLGHPLLDGPLKAFTAEQAQLAGGESGVVAAATTTLAKGALGGSLGGARRDRAIAEIGEQVDRWLTSTYLQGRDAGTRSNLKPGLMTKRVAHDVGTRPVLRGPGQMEAVEVRKRKISVDLLAVKGAARAATARVRLELTPTNDRRPIVIKGRLFLERHRDTWRIFGYDLAKAGGR